MTEGAAWRYTAMQAEAGRDAASGTPSPSSPKSGDDPSSAEQAPELTEENAYMASQQVLRAWSLDLDNAADSRIYS